MDKKMFIFKNEITNQKEMAAEIIENVANFSIKKEEREKFIKEMIKPYIKILKFIDDINGKEVDSFNNFYHYVMEKMEKINKNLEKYNKVLCEVFEDLQNEKKETVEEYENKTEEEKMKQLVSASEKMYLYKYISNFNKLNILYLDLKLYILDEFEKEMNKMNTEGSRV